MGKNAVSVLICVVSLVFMLFGCTDNKNQEIIGEWVPTTATIDGSTVKYEELGIEKDQFGFEFKENGKCVATIAGLTEESQYTFNGTSVDIEINGQSHKLSYDNGSLTLSFNYSEGYTTFTFTKVNVQ